MSASMTPPGSPTSRKDLRRQPSSSAVAWLAEQGVMVKQVMTDNGSGYVSKAFAVSLAEIRAKHRRTRSYTPRTNSKAERFIQTLMQEWAYSRPFTSSYRRRAALPAWLRRYNERRPMLASGRRTNHSAETERRVKNLLRNDN